MSDTTHTIRTMLTSCKTHDDIYEVLRSLSKNEIEKVFIAIVDFEEFFELTMRDQAIKNCISNFACSRP